MQIDLGPFRKALSSLARGIACAEAAFLDEELRDAVIQRFEFTYRYEIARKSLRLVLVEAAASAGTTAPAPFSPQAASSVASSSAVARKAAPKAEKQSPLRRNFDRLVRRIGELRESSAAKTEVGEAILAYWANGFAPILASRFPKDCKMAPTFPQIISCTNPARERAI